MAYDRLQAVYEALCHELGREPGTLPREAHGRHFRIDVGGVPVTVLHSPERGEDCLLVMASLGPLPVGDEESQLAALLDFNFRTLSTMSGVASSRNPDSGDVYLQYTHPLEDCDVVEFLERVRSVAGCAPVGAFVGDVH